MLGWMSTHAGLVSMVACCSWVSMCSDMLLRTCTCDSPSAPLYSCTRASVSNSDKCVATSAAGHSQCLSGITVLAVVRSMPFAQCAAPPLFTALMLYSVSCCSRPGLRPHTRPSTCCVVDARQFTLQREYIGFCKDAVM